MEVYYILDDNGVPRRENNFENWQQWEAHADRCVARTNINPECTVLTVFLAMADIENDSETPKLFYTRVYGGLFCGEEKFSSTKEEALAKHEFMCMWCRAENVPDLGICDDLLL